jgi:uncharacterized protein YaaN involved in tellurite resistance
MEYLESELLFIYESFNQLKDYNKTLQKINNAGITIEINDLIMLIKCRKQDIKQDIELLDKTIQETFNHIKMLKLEIIQETYKLRALRLKRQIIYRDIKNLIPR